MNINDETAQALQGLAESHGTTVTEIVRRAIGVYRFVDDDLRKDDMALQLVNTETKEVSRLHLV